MWLLLAAVLSGCGGRAEGPPEIVVDRDACSHCGMLISEPMYAAAARTDGSAPRVFDDIGCLRHAVRGERGPITSWFHDADGGGWIDGGVAIFVASPEIRSPMHGGVIAFRDRAAAERAAAARRGRVIPSVAALLAEGAS